MIARVWRCIAANDKVSDYTAHFEHAVLPELRELQGFEAYYVLQRALDDGVELTVMTMWESMDAVRKFAGDDPEMAVVAPAAQSVLRSFDVRVTHHEVLRQGTH
jgi:heme-degrading monooxygenase HmoA